MGVDRKLILDGMVLDHILDEWEISQEQNVSIDEFVNNEPDVVLDLWNRLPKTLIFRCREEHNGKWTIEKSARKHTSVHLADGPTLYAVWIKHISSRYAGDVIYDKPWEMEITLIILGVL